ncbi:MAG: tRNA (guanosine(46)-N7)-methyltransferase TrmB [Ruminiclostridium sp.]|nr:tRNA (guanosine(46)-N7)-methyltransferase TrmB [Ruminiclostridium sp.]
MRMRKKRHLAERLEACSDVNLGWIPDPAHEDGGVCRRSSADIFGNEKPLHLEIGCGKGKFINTLAGLHPDINYIAVEQTPNVIVSAMEQTISEGHDNLRYFMGNAGYLRNVLADNSTELIYLNFSCPYPKARYTKHRLTSERFLPIYREILINDGRILQKTDNEEFFDYSLGTLKEFGFDITYVTRDLHNSDVKGNIITEYEQRFLSQGLPIFYLEAVNKK